MPRKYTLLSHASPRKQLHNSDENPSSSSQYTEVGSISHTLSTPVFWSPFRGLPVLHVQDNLEIIIYVLKTTSGEYTAQEDQDTSQRTRID